MATSRRTQFLFAVAAVLIATSAILASLRLGLRMPSLVQYIRPRPLHTPAALATHPFRPLTNSTMAPTQYRKPPQLPPRFTATKETLISDTKRLVGNARAACFGRYGLADMAAD